MKTSPRHRPQSAIRTPLSVRPAPRLRAGASIGLSALLLASGAFADTTDEGGEEAADETITVVATRTEQPLDAVAATVSVKTAEQIEEELARDIADLVRFEPGVSVAGTGSRFGLSGFRIRGIGGNRVLTLIDGVRVPDEFSFGPFLSARRDLVDIDSLRRAEIARGPVSALWGSDALGGVVSFTTKSPRDRLDPGDAFAAAFKGGHSSADGSTVGTVDLAAARGPLSAMLLYTRRSGQETDTAGAIAGTGADREKPDPQENTSDNVVAKVVFSPSARHRLALGIDLYANDTTSEILSDYGSVVFGTTVNRRDADDARQRQRTSLAYRYAAPLAIADRIDLTLYRQSGETTQRTREERTTRTRAMQTRRRDSFYEQRIDGVAVQFGKRFATGGVGHALTYGAEHFVTSNAGLRDGGTFDAAGSPVREFSPLPTRDFPLTDVAQTALFVQDEIELLGGALLLSPGLRFDRFDADAEPDSIYLSGNPGSATPEDYGDSEITAKIGAVYRFNSAFSAYAGYSEGFRAPPYDDVNVGFTNFLGGYKTVANPNLESERSRGVEVGARFVSDAVELRWSLFRNDYEDFIESFALAPRFLRSGGIDPADGLRTFQSVNRANVRIQGSELSGAAVFGGGFSGRLALAYADGEDRAAGAPLSSVDPLTTVLGLGYDAPSGRWGGQLVGTLVRGKDAADIDPADGRPATAGYGIVDLLAHMNLGSRTRIHVGLFNLTDKTYVRWADTASVGADAMARFTQPGRNAAVTVRVEM